MNDMQAGLVLSTWAERNDVQQLAPIQPSPILLSVALLSLMDPRVRRLSAIAYLCRLILLEDLLNAQWPFNTRYYMIELCPGLRWGTGPLSHGTTGTPDLEAVDLYGLLVETETVLGVAEELLDLQAVIALQLNHLAHALGLGVTDDGSIAGCVLGQHEWM
jgi:hypothetical protein